MRLKKSHKVLYIAFVLFTIAGLVFEFLSRHAPVPAFSVENFQKTVFHTIKKSDDLVTQIVNGDDLSDETPPSNFFQVKQEIAVFVYQDDELLLWNSNLYEIDEQAIHKDEQWHLVHLPNAYGIYKWYNQADDTAILAFIPIKTDYPYENDYLIKSFLPRFKIDDSIEISESIDSNGGIIITAPNGDFLFSLVPDTTTNIHKSIQTAGFVMFTISFFLLLMLFFNINSFLKTKHLTNLQFFVATALIGTVLLLGIYTGFPKLFFANHLFETKDYAASQLINTLISLTVIGLFVLVALLLFYTKVIEKKPKLLVRKVFFLFYLLFYFEIFKRLVLHTNISFCISNIHEIDYFNIWAQVLVFILSIGLFVFLLIINNKQTKPQKISKLIPVDFLLAGIGIFIYSLIFREFVTLFTGLLLTVIAFNYIWIYLLDKKITRNIFAVFMLLISVLVFYDAYYFTAYKKSNKYRIQAENILINGHAPDDPFAILLLEDLDKSLKQDHKLKTLSTGALETDSIINQYLYQKYLQGFWNQFTVHIRTLPRNSHEMSYYVRFLEFAGKKIKNTDFYSLPASLYDISFMGLVDIYQNEPELQSSDKHKLLVFEFQPKTNFRSYSFPDLLISEEADAKRQKQISIAKYEYDRLTYSDSKYNWNETDLIFNNADEGFTKLKYKDKKFYIFKKGYTKIVITEITTFSFRNFIFYALFAVLVYLLCTMGVSHLYQIIRQRRVNPPSLTGKFQFVFIFMLLISFISILIFSLNYIRNDYQQEQISGLEKKKHYVQKSLQDLYYWTEDIRMVDRQDLNNNLQELAYRYQVDINVFDNAGRLRGSSQSLIFSNHLISDLMSPEIYFTENETQNQYEQIGNLTYLAAYTDLLNGDFLQIGFISIPQYFSQTEINAKLDQFSGTVVQIYLIVMIFSVILILIAGRRIAEPLHQLENKMKLMRLDGKNEKVEYKSKDEIGQLVEQYNRTVEELEKNTQLLLASERETTWRTMARQVAHEINNPLTPMKLTLQQLQRTKDVNPEQFDKYFVKATQTLIEQINNLSRIAGTFSEIARMPEIKFTAIDIAKKLVSVIHLFKLNEEHIHIIYDGPQSDVIIDCDAEQIVQVFNNILKNATQAFKRGAKSKSVKSKTAKGTIKVVLTEDQETVTIAFTDDGPGIPESIQENIFKPNFTTKSTGMGLGLSISKSIIENMGGEISFTTTLDIGTTFTIKLHKKRHEN